MIKTDEKGQSPGAHVESRLSHLFCEYMHLNYGTITIEYWDLWIHYDYTFYLHTSPGQRRLEQGSVVCVFSYFLVPWTAAPFPDSDQFWQLQKTGICNTSWTQNIYSPLTMCNLINSWTVLARTASLYGLKNKWWIVELLSVWKICKDYGCGREYSCWKWNLDYIRPLSFIDLKVRHVVCCDQEMLENCKYIFPLWMNLQWEQELFPGETWGSLI